jgi:lipid II:glycine glycyltransferase (peptidoglycan interpeptide bridge formation enzyme)
MNRHKADKFYYFSKEWFSSIKALLCDNVTLVHAVYHGRIVASTIYLFNENHIHYFLQGSEYEMRHLAANNLSIYETALWAKSRGVRYFYLGGGYKANDNVLRFKATFSPLRAQFYVGKVVMNDYYYKYLTIRKQAAEGITILDPDREFFPEYRIQRSGQ